MTNPGDLPSKLRKPGSHWAYDSYSKAEGMGNFSDGGVDTAFNWAKAKPVE